MTKEDVMLLIAEINKKMELQEKLTKFEDLVLEEVKLAKKENREISVRAVEDYKFWMD